MKEVSTLMIYLILAKIGGEITAFKVTKNPQWFEGATKKMWFNDDNGGRKKNIEQLHIKV